MIAYTLGVSQNTEPPKAHSLEMINQNFEVPEAHPYRSINFRRKPYDDETTVKLPPKVYESIVQRRVGCHPVLWRSKVQPVEGAAEGGSFQVGDVFPKIFLCFFLTLCHL